MLIGAGLGAGNLMISAPLLTLTNCHKPCGIKADFSKDSVRVDVVQPFYAHETYYQAGVTIGRGAKCYLDSYNFHHHVFRIDVDWPIACLCASLSSGRANCGRVYLVLHKPH